MQRIELQSHFIRGLMLVTDLSPGALEPLLTKTLAEVDPNLTINSVRTLQQQVELSFDQERSVASLAGLFGIVALLLAAIGSTASRPTPSRSAPTRSASAWRSAPIASNVVDLVLRGAFSACRVGLALGCRWRSAPAG